jgi:hypothetical protein
MGTAGRKLIVSLSPPDDFKGTHIEKKESRAALLISSRYRDVD